MEPINNSQEPLIPRFCRLSEDIAVNQSMLPTSAEILRGFTNRPAMAGFVRHASADASPRAAASGTDIGIKNAEE
jgi:hypothetical protein